MMDALVFLGPALAMCLVIASIHVYLGMHVLAREVIFVDLSLAQLAALGATVAALFTAEEEPGWQAHLTALGFTIVGAAIFAFTRRVRNHVSQEAIVGIVYAVASAVTVLVVSHSPHGAEHIKDILVGSLLNTTWTDVWHTALAYVVLGALQLFLAKRFIAISWRPEEAEQQSRFVELWDLGFYVLFGLVITISVQFAGILLVFSFLIVPAVITRLFSDQMRNRLFAGWGVAIAASALGLWASWSWDLPTGAAIVAAFGALLALAGISRAILPARA
ncbi:MAG TPA: iron chelate uptake ABC transporter family permease subunit [Polyangiaceae bacterium]|nr:iron chelate uptake ABC transporter family permease subunit [Polyangiaceae bacterium]